MHRNVTLLPAIAQKPPTAPDRPWHSAEESQIANDAKSFLQPAFLPESGREWSLAELIDLAESAQSQHACSVGNRAGPRSGVGNCPQRTLSGALSRNGCRRGPPGGPSGNSVLSLHGAGI